MADSAGQAAPLSLPRERAVAAGEEVLAAQAPARLELQGIVKRWSRGRIQVLEEVDLAVAPGEIVVIVGTNGCGKTTLLRIAAGLIAADAGTVLLDGLRPAKDRVEYQRRLGFGPAGYGGLYVRMTVRQHLDLWARLAFVPRSRRQAICADAIRRFQLTDLAERRIDRLSMGQRQRVHLAMAFLHQPRLVLLDEPWNSLDEAGSDLLAGALGQLAAGGGSAVVCVPTGTDATLRIAADRLLRLENGRLGQ